METKTLQEKQEQVRYLIEHEPLKALSLVKQVIKQSLVPYTYIIPGDVRVVQVLSGENGCTEFFDMVGDNMDQHDGNVCLSLVTNDEEMQHDLDLGMHVEIMKMDEHLFFIDMTDVKDYMLDIEALHEEEL